MNLLIYRNSNIVFHKYNLFDDKNSDMLMNLRMINVNSDTKIKTNYFIDIYINSEMEKNLFDNKFRRDEESVADICSDMVVRLLSTKMHI